METGERNGSEPAEGQEKYLVDAELKRQLTRSVNIVGNVLAALTYTGREDLLREKRREELEKMQTPLAGYILDRKEASARGLMRSYAQVWQAQNNVINARHKAMDDIDISEIVEVLSQITEDCYERPADSHEVMEAIEIQQNVTYELNRIQEMLYLEDMPISQRIMSFRSGIRDAFDYDAVAPIRFMLRSIPNLLADVKQIDERIKDMPEKYEQWRVVKEENDKLRQLLTQFI